MREDAFYNLFALRIRELLRESRVNPETLQEIRLRADRPLLLRCPDGEYAVRGDGTLTTDAAQGYRATRQELDESLEYIAGYSLYAFDEELKRGFLTVPGGHRVGVAGRLVMEGDRVQCIRHISFINVRLAHQLIGCADGVLPYLVEDGEICHSLIISPPGCGKTTLLRDLIRQISDGSRYAGGRCVGVVDERCELAGSYQGIPQNDLGARTDVLECGPKSAGMMMLLRSMSPQVMAVDEIGGPGDGDALEQVFHCGCKLIATVHGTSLEDIRRKPLLGRLVAERLFERYVVLGRGKAGQILGIYDGDGGSVIPCG